MSDCLFEISKIGEKNYKSMYILSYKGKPVATNLTLDEAVDMAKEIQSHDC